jgi:hypothetical protein
VQIFYQETKKKFMEGVDILSLEMQTLFEEEDLRIWFQGNNISWPLLNATVVDTDQSVTMSRVLQLNTALTNNPKTSGYILLHNQYYQVSRDLSETERKKLH